MTVGSIAILRPSALGDLVFALPALRALRDTWPRTRLVFLGKRWHTEFLPYRDVVDEVLEVPPVPGVTVPENARHDAAGVEAFCEQMRARRFDLVLQLFGGGRFSNPLVKRLRARRSVGLRARDAEALDRWLPYLPLQNERLRLLEAVALAGARITGLAPPLPVLERDRDELATRLPLPAQPLAVLQPGASDARRRWPAERFAQVGDALAREGAAIAVHGSGNESAVTARVTRAMQAPAIDAGGVLSISGLAALLARARLVVSNDTGPLHLAHAVGTATVGIYWFTNFLVSAPLVNGSHRHALSLRTRCPLCGAENLTSRCEHDETFVDDVGPEEVTALALELWREMRYPSVRSQS